MAKLELRLRVPAEVKAGSILDFAAELSGVEGADRYVFDLSNVGFVEPFGMLLCGAVLRQFKENRSTEMRSPEFRFRGYEGLTYAQHMGFLRSFGVEYGNAPGEATGNSRYIPITRLPIGSFYEEAAHNWVVVGEAVELQSRRIAQVLTQQKTGALCDTLTYSLREIIRNVVEHSKADAVWYAAQYWPTRSRVEIGVLDEGEGIRTALSRNQRHASVDDANALRLAVQPGVSGVARAEDPSARPENDPWANSGYGLYLTSSICRRGGEFLICSGSKALSLTDEAELRETSFRGTAIQMVLDTSRIGDFSRTLDTIRRAGERAAGRSSTGGNLSASMISRMLSHDPSEEEEPEERIEDLLGPGTRVVHPAFGAGMVMSVHTLDGDQRVTIMFDDAGTRTVVTRFASLELESA